MKNVLLDTHILYWYINQTPNKLSPTMIEIIECADEIFISAITCFELSWLIHHQRIQLAIPYTEWFQSVLDYGVKVLPITAEIAHLAVILPEHHKDPHDRLIIATALHHQYRVLSIDHAFDLYDELQHLR